MDFMSAIVALLCLLALLATYINFMNKDLPPGPYGLPYVGYIPFLGKNPVITMTNLKEKYGNVVRIRLGPKTVVILNDFKAMKEAFVKQGDTFSGRPIQFKSNTAFTKKGIIAADGLTWKAQRHFSLQSLRDFGFGRSSMESVIMYEVDRLSDYLNDRAGQHIDISEIFILPVLNVISGITAGKRYDKIDHFISCLTEFVQLMALGGNYSSLNYLPFIRHFNPRLRQQFIRYARAAEKINAHLEQQIDSHVDNFNEQNLKDFIDVYLNENQKHRGKDDEETPPYNRAHLVSTLFDLFVAGGDTTDTTMRWAILHMALNPDVQRKVQEELDSVVAKDSFISLSAKALAPYTEATILESLRHPTLVPLTDPHRALKETTLQGFRIPKDTIVYGNMYAAHHDKNNWDEPDTFRPERFLDDTGKTVLRPEYFLPFSHGPRACMAESLARLELHLLFTCLLRRFTWQTIPAQPKPSTNIIAGSIFRMEPFSLIVRPRN